MTKPWQVSKTPKEVRTSKKRKATGDGPQPTALQKAEEEEVATASAEAVFDDDPVVVVEDDDPPDFDFWGEVNAQLISASSSSTAL